MADSAKDEAKTALMAPVLHSRVMRIREEEEHVGNNLLESRISPKDRAALLHLTAHMKDVLVSNSKPTIPSRLGTERARALAVNR